MIGRGFTSLFAGNVGLLSALEVMQHSLPLSRMIIPAYTHRHLYPAQLLKPKESLPELIAA